MYNFKLVNSAYARQVLHKSGASGISLFMYNNSEDNPKPVSFLYYKHLSHQVVDMYAKELHQYDPLMPHKTSIYRNCDQFTDLKLWFTDQGSAQSKPYIRYFSKLGFKETAVSVKSISGNMFLVVGLHSTDQRHHLSIDRAQSEMERWLNESRDYVVDYSVKKFHNQIAFGIGDSCASNIESLDKMLTNRQFQVVCELLKGKSNKQIATALGLSEYTVENYLRKIYKIFNIHSRAALLALISDQKPLS
ncbi:MAG: response regulator transcription factor [Porticoccaceae bacterium]